MIKIYLVVIAFAALALQSCGTIFTGTHQRIVIDSEPQGAEIFIEGDSVGVTPSKVLVRRRLFDLQNGGKTVRLEKDGYRKAKRSIYVSMNPACIFNTIFLLPHWGVDLATGAIARYEPYNFYYLEPDTNFKYESNPKPAVEIDKFDRLLKLKKLLDEGAITQEEFDKEKAKILEENSLPE